jgi:hypothetical protein
METKLNKSLVHHDYFDSVWIDLITNLWSSSLIPGTVYILSLA